MTFIDGFFYYFFPVSGWLTQAQAAATDDTGDRSTFDDYDIRIGLYVICLECELLCGIERKGVQSHCFPDVEPNIFTKKK